MDSAKEDTQKQQVGHKYARGELFKLASRVASHDSDFMKQLKAFEKADKASYNLDRACGPNQRQFGSNGQVTFAGKPFKLIRSVSNFSRTNNNNGRLNNDHWHRANSNQSYTASSANEPASKRLSRMTSSPSIQYTKPARRNAEDTRNIVDIPAKYQAPTGARPFESSDKDARQQQQQRQQVNSRKKPPKRPSFSRGSSTETQSLTPLYAGKASADLDMSDWPIKRFSSTKKPAQEDGRACELADEEDDNFELTSLVSITVLSDIKTIRQDLLQGNGEHGNLSLGQQQLATGRAKGRFKRPNRSNSSMEFTHHGRILNDAIKQPARPEPCGNIEALSKTRAYDAMAQPPVLSPDLYYPSQTTYETDQPESLMGFQYDWDTLRSFDISASSSQLNPRYSSGRLARRVSPARPTAVVDESAVQIRERFMAEVKARAQLASISVKQQAVDTKPSTKDDDKDPPARPTEGELEQAARFSGIPKLQTSSRATKLSSGIPRLVDLHKVKLTVDAEETTTK